MDNVSRMAEQIAIEEECRISTARRACMIEAFASAGKDIDYAASALGLTVKTVKDYAKRFNISFGET